MELLFWTDFSCSCNISLLVRRGWFCMMSEISSILERIRHHYRGDPHARRGVVWRMILRNMWRRHCWIGPPIHVRRRRCHGIIGWRVMRKSRWMLVEGTRMRLISRALCRLVHDGTSRRLISRTLCRLVHGTSRRLKERRSWWWIRARGRFRSARDMSTHSIRILLQIVRHRSKRRRRRPWAHFTQRLHQSVDRSLVPNRLPHIRPYRL